MKILIQENKDNTTSSIRKYNPNIIFLEYNFKQSMTELLDDMVEDKSILLKGTSSDVLKNIIPEMKIKTKIRS